MGQKSTNQKFIEEISKISDPTTFLGVCRILKVELLSEEKDEEGKPIPRSFELLFKDVMENYARAPRERRRELLKILSRANKEDFKHNATRTQNTEETVSGEGMPEM